MLSRGYLSSLRALFSSRQPGEPSRCRTKRNRIRRHGGTERLEDRTLLTAPYSANDSYSVAAGGVLTVPPNGVLANDFDMDGNTLTAQLYMPAPMGTVTLSSNGSFVYTAPSAFTGTVPFYYRAFDGTEFGNMATVNITVTSGGSSGGGGGSSNQPPVPVADSFFVEQNTSGAKLPVLWNDTDPNSNPLSITSVTTPDHGTASSQFDSYTNMNVVSYSPTSGYTGSDSFNYTISDGSLTASTTDTLTIHAVDNTIAQARPLTPTNNVRLATGGIIGDGPQSWSDVDIFSVSLTAGQVITFDLDSASIDSGGSYGSFNGLLRLFSSGGTQVASNDNGTDPDTNASGNDPFLSYTVTTSGTYYLGVSDSSNATYSPNTSGGGYGMMSGAYVLQVLRSVPNQPPVATSDSASTHHGTAINIPVLSNDSDPNGDSLTVTQAGTGSHGTTQIVTVGGVSQVRYTPTSGYVGPDSFTYTIGDPSGATATATVSVSVTNSNPLAVAESYTAVAGVTRNVAAGGVLTNDSDADSDSLTATLVSGVSHGTLSLNANGSLTYLATTGYSGSDSFVYRAFDGAGDSANTTVMLTVYASHVIAASDAYSVGHDKTLTVAAPGLLANDWSYENQALTAVLVTSPTHGALTLNGNGSFVYVPDSGYVGADSFSYRATNGTQQSSVITVPLTVTNFAPWAVNDLYVVRHDRIATRTAVGGVLKNDVDVEDDALTVSLISGTAHGTLSLSADGAFSFNPDAGYTGTTGFTYRVSDGFNLSQIATATIQVLNNAPDPGEDWFYTPAGQSLAIGLADLKSNDVDADNDSLTLSVSASPLHGTLTVQPNGDFLYQPNVAWSGTDTFTYTVSDGLATSAPATVSIKVSNTDPIGVSDFYNLRHDRPLVVTTTSVIANDIDDDDDALSVILHTPPATGTLVLNADGTFVYTPEPGATGDVTFKYRVTDGIVTSAPVTATIRIRNAIPVGRTDSYQIHQGDTLSVSAGNGVLENDTDADNDQLAVSLFSGAAHGTLSLNANGSFSYTPNAGFSGSDSFSYCVTDGLVTSAPVVVSISVSNFAPVANSNAYTLVHDRIRTVAVGNGVLANDFDVDADSLTAVLVTGPSHGTLQLQTNGSFTYTPTSNYTGVDSFVYKAFDGSAYSDPESVTLTVTNNRPWTVNRSFAAAHDHSISIATPGLLAFSGDRDSDVLSIIAGSAPDHGSLVLNADGSFIYTPDAGFVGSDTFGYKVSDGLQESAEAIVTIRVFNRLPVARTDYYSISHDRPLFVSAVTGVLQNDSDLDDDNLTVTLVAGEGPEHGTLSLQSNGSFTYTPAGGFVGTDSFRYRVFDGAQSVEGTVNLSVQNSRPVGENDKYGAVVGQTLNVSAATGVLFNDVDGDQDVLQAVLVSGTTHGTLSLSANGSFSYTPDEGFIGVDTFRYQAKDSINSLSFVKTVSISTALVAGHDELEVSHDRVLSGDVTDNDHSIPGTTPVYSLVTGPASGTLSLGSNGTFTYTPVADFVGEATFTYRFAVNGHFSNTATATISVVNEAPLVFTGTWRTSHGKTITATSANGLAFRSRDRDGDDLSFAIMTQPTHGTMTLNPATGAFTYVPSSSSYTGSDSFQWRAHDGITWSAIKTGYIELLNRKASLSSDSYQVHSGQTLTVLTVNGLLTNDYDSDGDSLQPTITAQPAQGTVTLNANGSFVYVPNAGVFNADDSFKYKVYDGAEWSAETTVTVKVSNALPSTRAEGYSIRHDNILSVPVSRGVLANDYDNDSDALSATIATQPSHGTLNLSANGGFTYQPDAGYAGTDSFTYRAFDGFQQSGLVTVSLTVTNKAPVAGADQFITRRNSPMAFTLADLKGNDSDADGDTLTLLPFSSPAHGSLSSSNGVWTYTPDAGFVGVDEFTYRVTDGVANSNLATVSIEVLNSAPVAAGDRFEVPHDQAFSGAAGVLKTNDFDIENDTLTTSLVTNVRNGTLSLQSNGAFTYTPNAGFIGRDSFSYRLSDGNLNSKPVRVILDVVNGRPTASDVWYRLTHDTVFTKPASSGLLSRTKDSDGDNLTASIVANVRNGTLSVTAAGGWTYTPNVGFVGTDSFSYRVSDGSLQSTAKTVQLEVGNTPVVASMDAYTTAPNTTLTVAAPGVLQNDSDVDDDTLLLTVVDDVLHGTLTLQQNGSFVYVPTSGYIGQDTFTYKVSDGIEDTTATVTLTVTGIPQSGLTIPVSRNDFYSTSHSTPLTVSRSAGVLSNDRDPNNDNLTAQLVAGTSHGTLTLNADGSFSYQPFSGNSTTAPFVGTDSFTYRVTDGSHLSAVTTAQIKVTNSLPWAANAAFETHQGQSIPVAIGQLSRHAGDNDQDFLNFSLVTNPANGSVTLNSNGTFSYTPDVGYSGTDTFVYRVRDAVGNSNNATVAIDVVNERPTAFDLEFSTTHGEVFNGSGRGVLAGASDQDNDTLTAHLVSNASHGTVVLNNDGTFTYTPVAGYAGDDQFFFKVSDGSEFSYNALVRLTVDNQKPVANDTFQSTQHDQPVVISLTAFDSDGDDLTYELVAAPQHGTLTYENLVNNGSNGQPIRFTGRVTYQPANGYSGEDTFRYRVNDGVTFSDNADVSLSVRNLVPRATDSMQRTIPGQPVVVTGTGLLATVSDPDGDPLTLQIVTQPAHGTLTLVQSGGVYTGGYTYTPNAGYAGNDSFRWRVSDGADVSDTVTVSLTVQNNAPTIADHFVRQRYREASVNNNGQRTYSVDLAASGIAVDSDKDALQYQIVTNGQHGTATLTSAGLLKWTSTSNSWTGSDKVIVRVTDGFSFSENAEININIDNTQPTAAGDFYSIHHNQTLTLTPEKLRGNDLDFDGDALQIVSVTNGANGTLTQSGNNWVFNPGTFIGTTELTYIVSDGLVNSEPATIEIEVTNAPVWGNDRSFTLIESSSIEFEISTASSGVVSPDGDATTISFTAQPSHGSLTSLGDNRWRYTPTPASSSGYNGSGNGTTTVTRGYLGHDQITFRISDGIVQSTPVTYSFNVIDALAQTEVNGLRDTTITDNTIPVLLQTPDLPSGQNSIPAPQLPEPNAKIHSVRPGGTASGQLDVPAGATIEFWNGSSWVNITAPSTAIALTGGSLVTISPDGNYSVTGSTASKGSRSEARFRISKNSLTTESRIAIVSTNSAPIPGAPYFTSTIGSLAAFVRDPNGDAITYTQHAGQPDVVTEGLNSLTIFPNGSYDFSPAPGGDHTTVLRMPFTVRDQFGASSTDLVHVLNRVDKTYVPPIPPSGQTDPPVAADSAGFYLAPVHPVSWLQASDGGHPSLNFELIGDGKGTFGVVRLWNRTVFYTPYPYAEGAFLEAGGEPTTFYYKVTNAIGSWDVGSISIDATFIGGGEIAMFGGSYAVSYFDDVGVAFDSAYGSWFYGDGQSNVFIDMPNIYNNDEPTYFQGNVTNKLRFEVQGDILSPIRISGNADIASWRAAIKQPVFAGSIRRLIATGGEYIAAFSDSYVEAASQRYTAAQQQELEIETGTVVAAEIGWVSWTVLGNAELVRWKAPITGTSLINSVLANGTLENVIKSGGNINCVRADLELKSTIQAGGTIGFGEVLPDYSRSIPEYWVSSRTVSGGSVNSLITAGSHINNVRSTTGEIDSIILAGGNIGVVNAEGGKVDSYIGALGRINQVAATDGIDGVIAALLTIGQVWTQASITATVLAGTGINTVEAWNNISGSIRALAGPIRLVSAGTKDSYGHAATGGSISSSVIYAGKSIGSVIARKVINTQGVAPGGNIQVTGGITAGGGYIGQVSAGQSIAATITALDDIGGVVAGSSITGSIQSKYGSVITVSATTEQISGQIKAKLNIGTVTAGTDRIGTTTAEIGSIQSVIATQGKIQGDTTAQNTLGIISAGTDILGNVTAITGSIDKILAGTFAPGNLSGDISAFGDIVSVDVKGVLPVSELESIDFSAVEAAFDALRQAAESQDVLAFANIVLPDLPVLPASIKGNISGSIVSGGSIYSLIADGKLSSDVTAERSLPNVWVYRTITGDLTAATGSVAVTTYGKLDGDVKGPRGVTGFSYDDTAGDLMANVGAVSFLVLGDLLGDATARNAVSTQTYGDVQGDTTAESGYADVVSLNSIFGTVYAGNTIATIGRRVIAGDLVSAIGSIFSGSSRITSGAVRAGQLDDDIRTTGLFTRFAGLDQATPQSPNTVSSIYSTAPEEYMAGLSEADDYRGISGLHGGIINVRSRILIIADGNVDADMKSAIGPVDIRARHVRSNIEVTHDSAENGDGYVKINALSGFVGGIRAPGDVVVSVWGEQSADETGEVNFVPGIINASNVNGLNVKLFASGSVSAHRIDAIMNVQIDSWDTVTTPDSGGIFANGSVRIFGFSSVTSGITATSNLWKYQDVSVFTWGDFSGDIVAGGAVSIKTGGDASGSVRSRYSTGISSYGKVSADATAGDLTLGHTGVAQRGALNGQILIFAGGLSEEGITTQAPTAYSGSLTSLNSGIFVLSYGSVNGTLKAEDKAAGAVSVVANPHGIATDSSFTGSVTAGAGATVLVVGSITDSTFVVGGDTAVGAGNSVENTTITNANHTAKIMVGADNQLSKVTVDGGNDLRLLAIEGIQQTTVKNVETMLVSSHGLARVKIRDSGSATISALGDIEADIILSGDLFLESAAGGIRGESSEQINPHLPPEQLRAEAGGKVTLLARNDVDYDVVATKGVVIQSGGKITGEYSGTTVRGLALKGIDGATFSSQLVTSAISGAAISGTMKSSKGSVTVRSSGNFGSEGQSNVNAQVEAKGSARVTALNGNVDGTITSTAGSVSVLASRDVSADIDAGASATVDAGRNVAGNVSADGAVDVYALWDITGDVNSWNGNVEVNAGWMISGGVYGDKDVFVSTLVEGITGYVYSALGGATVYSGSQVSGSVDAERDVLVRAVRDVTGDLTSRKGSVDVLSVGGAVNAKTDAKGSIDIWALGNSSKDATATNGDVNIRVFGDRVSGIVTAGRDINVSAGGMIASETITAAHSLDLWAGGDITVAAATATYGDAIVSPWGKHSGKVQANEGEITFLTGGNSTSSTLLGKSVRATIWGDATSLHAAATTTTSVVVFGNLNGVATGKDGVGVKAWGEENTVTLGSAEGDASVWSLGNLDATIDVEKHGRVTSFGTLELDVTTGGSVYAWSLSDVSGYTDAGRYSTLVGWGNVNIESEGDLGAFAWSYGTLRGSQTSTDGYAIAVSNLDNLAAVDAKTLAVAVSLDNVSGAVTSDDMALVIAGSDATSAVTTTSGSMAIIAFGNVQASASSGEHAVVVANGNITGSVAAKKNIVAFAIGNLDAGLIAEQDIVFAGAGNSLTGTIVGYRDVWHVFSYGTINANVAALGLTDGGIVHKVQGVTSVAGVISGTSAFEYGRTGGDWTATVSAPETPAPAIIEYDASMAAEFPPITPVNLNKAAVRGVLAGIYAAHLVEKGVWNALKSVKTAATAARRQDELNKISTGSDDQADVATYLDNDHYDAWLEEANSYHEHLVSLRERSAGLEQSELQQLLKRQRDGEALRQQALKSAKGIHDAAVEASQELIASLKAEKLSAKFGRVAALGHAERTSLELSFALDTARINRAFITGDKIISLAVGGNRVLSRLRVLFSLVPRAEQVWKNAKEAGHTEEAAALEVLGILFFDVTGAMGWYHAIEGVDPVTLESFTHEQRFMEAINGTLQLAGTAIAGAKALDQLKGPCGGFFTERCFVGETLVLTGENAPWSYAENIGLQPTEDQQLSLAQWCWILGLGSAVVAFGAAKLSDERKKKKAAAFLPDGHDRLFADDPETRFLDQEGDLTPNSMVVAQAAKQEAPMAAADHGGSRDNAAMTGSPDIVATSTAPRASFVARGLGVIAVVLLAVSSLLSLRDAGGPPSPMSVASANVGLVESKAPRYSSKPIRDIQPIAGRVLADNPETDGQAPSDFGEFTAADWRILRLVVPKPDREWMKVTLARPQEWIEAAKRDPEGRLWLEFKELGIANWANVLAIEPCSEAAVGQGRLVTGKFEHSSAEVIDLFVDGVSEPIGTTSNHPFWSEDRRDFVQAGKLGIGERLRLRNGSTPVVTAAVPRSHSVPVFNLEVDGEHVYYVAANGLLVHNSYEDDDEINDAFKTADGEWIEDEELARRSDMNVRGLGDIYLLDGEVNATPTGEPYVGSTDDLDWRDATSTDGRDRWNAPVIDRYMEGDWVERYNKERWWVEFFGLENLDNKIMPPDPKP